MDKEQYDEEVMGSVHECLIDETDSQHAVLIRYNGKTGTVHTYAINAQYDIVRMLVTTAAQLVNDDNEERTVN